MKGKVCIKLTLLAFIIMFASHGQVFSQEGLKAGVMEQQKELQGAESPHINTGNGPGGEKPVPAIQSLRPAIPAQQIRPSGPAQSLRPSGPAQQMRPSDPAQTLRPSGPAQQMRPSTTK